MVGTLKFYAWKRSPLYDNVDPNPTKGRLTGHVTLTVRDDFNPADTLSHAIAFSIMSARDIAGVSRSAIRRTAPRPDTQDAETTKCVHVEFAEADFPWRYTPQKANGNILRPWLVLIVGTTDEIKIVSNRVVVNDNQVYADHPLTESHRWAHIQGSDDDSMQVARLFSPRKLAPQKEHIAALVPAFDYNPQTGAVFDSWGAQPPAQALPTYYWWRFWTAEAGDFETLAEALHPVKIAGLGVANVTYTRHSDAAEITLPVRGAITSLATAPDTEPEGLQAAIDDLDPLTQPQRYQGEQRIVSLPAYAALWTPDPEATSWGTMLNDDPRYRGIAGLGLHMGIVEQEQLVGAAVAEAGALDTAARLLRDLAFGLGAAHSLWNRRLPKDPAEQLWLFGSAMSRLHTASGTVMSEITAPDRPLDAELFSGAARRLLRGGTAWMRQSRGGYISRSDLLHEANTCPPDVEPHPARLPHIDMLIGELTAEGFGMESFEEMLELPRIPPEFAAALASLEGEIIDSGWIDRLAEMLRQFALGDVIDSCADEMWSTLTVYENEVATLEVLWRIVIACLTRGARFPHERLDDFPTSVGETDPPEPPEICRPIQDWGALGGAVSGAIDPNGENAPVIQRICSMITVGGLPACSPAPLEVPISLDFATWMLLRDHAREWLLPGVGRLEKNAVVAMESNPTFIDAYLLGLNTQFLDELHWRNIAIDRTRMPLLMFWGHINFEGDHKRMPDVYSVNDSSHAWAQTSTLGDRAHQVVHANDPQGNRDLIVVFHSDLFRRYPSTVIYLLQADDATIDTRMEQSPMPFAPPQRIGSMFRGNIEPDIVFFAFNIDPNDIEQYWVVLDEPPAELRFRSDEYHTRRGSGTLGNDGATVAAQIIDEHSRVAIRGRNLITI